MPQNRIFLLSTCAISFPEPVYWQKEKFTYSVFQWHPFGQKNIAKPTKRKEVCTATLEPNVCHRVQSRPKPFTSAPPETPNI